jgi:hypothetical protein
MPLTVEDALRQAVDRAELLRYVADLASDSAERPEPEVLSALADLCEELQQTLTSVKASRGVDALCTHVRREGTRGRS